MGFTRWLVSVPLDSKLAQPFYHRPAPNTVMRLHKTKASFKTPDAQPRPPFPLISG